jgi:Uma2 family endonuclease
MLVKKAQRYRACGTQEVWIFSKEARGTFLYSEQRRAILDENDEFRPEAIPGFAIRIGDCWTATKATATVQVIYRRCAREKRVQ